MLTHRNMSPTSEVEGTRHAERDDTLVCVLPLFHIYGMQVILNFGLYKGATVITMARFDLEALLKLIQDHRVTMAHLVPPIVLALAKSPLVERYDLSSVKGVFSGAAPLGVQVAEDCCRRLRCTMRQGYGMTERARSRNDPPEAEWDKPGRSASSRRHGLQAGGPRRAGNSASARGEICVREARR